MTWIQALPIPSEYQLTRTQPWILLTSPGGAAATVAQGWKLHVSARPETLESTVLAVIPLLFEEGCDFKVVADLSILSAFNHGLYGMGAVGKAITVYPAQDRISEIAHRLADVLGDREAPRIRSDRQLRSGAPVYYRFGPFSPRVRIDDSGYVDVTVQGPDGQRESGSARETYWAPEWADDPFRDCPMPVAHLPKVGGAPLIGDHYRIVGAIARTVRGSTYRAVDIRTERAVVIKSANAYVNETPAGDSRSYLRHELRVLRALNGVGQVPQAVDHFAYGADEYLVTSDLGDCDLLNDVVDRGLFDVAGSSERSVLVLARSIVRALDSIHDRGVVFRDLAPQNVVTMADGQWGLVDFELSRFQDVQQFGWTPAFSGIGQRNNNPAAATDDYFSLGALLFYAVMGMDPIIIDDGPTFDVDRTVMCLMAEYGDDAPIVSVVGALLSSNVSDRVRTVAQIRTGEDLPSGSMAVFRRQATAPLEVLARNTCDAVVRLADDALSQIGSGEGLPPSLVAQVGTAGLVAELAMHPRGVAAATDLAAAMAHVIGRVEAPASLLYGRMGVALALDAAANASHHAGLQEAARAVLPDASDILSEGRFDVAHGLAGLGIGYLALASSAPLAPVVLPLADDCAGRITDSADLFEEQCRRLPVGNPDHGISVADGFAHGRAGVAYFLLAHAAHSSQGSSADPARAMLDDLAAKVPDLVLRVGSARVRPMSVSWCQGLAGIGAALVRGAYVFDEDSYLVAARNAAKACLTVAPRVPLVTQCCGLAGVGELFLDLYLITDDRHCREDALTILGLMLARSGGSAAAPRFPGSNLIDEAIGWGNGSPGVLAFLRRLLDPWSPRLWMADAGLIPSVPAPPFAAEAPPSPGRRTKSSTRLASARPGLADP